MARINCFHEYEPDDLNDKEVDRIVKVMSISTRHHLREMQGHPKECSIHTGGVCSHA